MLHVLLGVSLNLIPGMKLVQGLQRGVGNLFGQLEKLTSEAQCSAQGSRGWLMWSSGLLMFEAVCIMTPPNPKIYHVGEMMPCRSMKKYDRHIDV